MLDLPPEAFTRHDETPDAQFYRVARLVTHLDHRAIGAVTQLYREYLPPDGVILDLMSSWVSHQPLEVRYHRVVGLGMNAAELAANPRLDEYVVQDLNQQPRLAFDDGVFDGAGLCVSIQYLTRPVEVLREVGRVLRPAAPLVITFSNRCFPTKAIAIWLALDDAGHGRLIERYLEAAGNWMAIERLDRSPGRRATQRANGRRPGDDEAADDPLFAVVARRRPHHREG